jgi:hypothetical protein
VALGVAWVRACRHRLAALGAQGRRRLWRGGARQRGLAAVGVCSSARVRGATQAGGRLRAGAWLGRREALRGLWRGGTRAAWACSARGAWVRGTTSARLWSGRYARASLILGEI